MPSEHRLHPTAMLFAFAGSLKAFALPGLLVLVAGRSSSGGTDGAFGRFPSGWEVWMMLFLIPAGLAAIARYLSFRIRYESDDLIVRSGLVFRNERHIPYSRIQNIEAIQNVFHRLLGVVEVRVENASGKETEARISVLPLAALDEMRARVSEGKARVAPRPSADTVPAAPQARASEGARPVGETVVRLSLRELLLFGFLENRGLVAIAALYGFLWEFGPLAGVWARMLDEGSARSGTVRETFRTLASGALPPLDQIGLILAGIVVFLIVVRLVSMAWAATRLYGFHLTRAGDELRTEYGLFTRVSATIPVRRIQTLTIRQSLLQRACARVSVRVETAGGQAGQRGGAVDREWLAPLVPASGLQTLVGHAIGDVDLSTIEWQPVHPRAFRRTVKPAIVLSLAVTAAVAALLGWRALVTLPFFAAWFAYAARQHVDRLGWAATTDVVLFRSGWLRRVTTIARVAKIQAVDWRESPFDRRTAMARVRVDTAGAGERSARVDIPYLPRDVAHDLHRQLANGAAGTDFRW